jgi:hypothetical protein
VKYVMAMVVLLLAATFSQAQDKPPKQPSPEEMQKIMESAMGPMVPLMARMTESMIQAQLELMSKPESAEKMARYVRNLYEALQKQGFSKEEALRIAIALPMPSAAAPMK